MKSLVCLGAFVYLQSSLLCLWGGSRCSCALWMVNCTPLWKSQLQVQTPEPTRRRTRIGRRSSSGTMAVSTGTVSLSLFPIQSFPRILKGPRECFKMLPKEPTHLGSVLRWRMLALFHLFRGSPCLIPSALLASRAGEAGQSLQLFTCPSRLLLSFLLTNLLLYSSHSPLEECEEEAVQKDSQEEGELHCVPPPSS